MTDNSSRREWLKKSAVALAGISLTSTLFATEKERYRASGIILLNSNENAYGPSAAARKAMSEALVNSNRYPDDLIAPLKQKLAKFWEVGPENILLGAGSSEIIGLACLMVTSLKANIITAEPSYRIWNGQAEAMGLQSKRVSISANKILDLESMLAAMNADTKMIYLCNPNNPVGTYVSIDQLKDFVNESSKKCLVFIDEAYTEYADLPSLKDLAIKNKNIIVAKTFSKIYGLAGARAGYAIAHPDTIQKLAAFQPWPDANVSMATAAAAIAALDDQAFVKDCREKNKQAREMCYKIFNELSLEYIPSHTNFILFNIDKIGSSFTEKMRAKNILVQYREHFGGKWCRVSMGTLEEMQQFCSTLKSTIS